MCGTVTKAPPLRDGHRRRVGTEYLCGTPARQTPRRNAPVYLLSSPSRSGLDRRREKLVRAIFRCRIQGMAWTRHPTYSASWVHSLILHRGRSSPVTDDRAIALESVFHAPRAQPTRESN
eukprot:30570-Pelagococcus_subviridis.AAC.2